MRFRDPKYHEDYLFPAKRLKGALEPPRVLKSQDHDQMNRGGDRYRPQIGFVPNNKVGALSEGGHRMLGY